MDLEYFIVEAIFIYIRCYKHIVLADKSDRYERKKKVKFNCGKYLLSVPTIVHCTLFLRSSYILFV